MMKHWKLLLILPFFGCFAHAQKVKTDERGNVHLHFGTVVVYTTYSIGYEGMDLLRSLPQHQIRPLVRVGGWNASLLNKNSGTQGSIGFSYLFGKGNHLLEHSSEFVGHFDAGLKGQALVFVGGLYRPYLGYRYQPQNKRIILKVGAGWREVVQFGVGWRI